MAPFLQPGLRHLERRSLGSDGGLDLVYERVLVLDLLHDHGQLGLEILLGLLALGHAGLESLKMRNISEHSFPFT